MESVGKRTCSKAPLSPPPAKRSRTTIEQLDRPASPVETKAKKGKAKKGKTKKVEMMAEDREKGEELVARLNEKLATMGTPPVYIVQCVEREYACTLLRRRTRRREPIAGRMSP